MSAARVGWTRWAGELEGSRFAAFQSKLAKYNALRFKPSLPDEAPEDELARESAVAIAEIAFVESLRRAIAPLTTDIADDVDGFIAWFEQLEETGPGQGDPLFPWLATTASVEQMKWFLLQEVAGEAGFEDLLAMTQVKMPVQAKLEMARNFWDEMGRGAGKGMHGPMLERLASYFELSPTPANVVPESLALGNTMIALAKHHRYAFHSVGCPRRHRDDGADASRICERGNAPPRCTDKKAALFRRARRTGCEAFGGLEPGGAAAAGRRKPPARPGDRGRRHHAALAWRKNLRTLPARV